MVLVIYSWIFESSIASIPMMPSMKHKLRLIYWVVIFTILASASRVLSQDSTLGQFERHSDIGSPTNAGSASYNQAEQMYTLSGSGANMWSTNDQFHFAWKKLRGDFIVRAQVEFVGKGVEEHRKIGWMARASLDDNSPYVDAVEHDNGLTSLQYRPKPGDETTQIVLPITGAAIIQLERRGSNYIFSAARNGETFVSASFSNITLPDDLFVGLFVCAHNPNVTETAIFRDVRLIKPVKPDFVPYRDYIGSVLEILDVQTGKLELVRNSATPFEAPNWTRDGKVLIYNISGRAEGWGRLARFDLDAKKETLIDTGACIKNNNDHVLSFDGTMLGISDQSPDHGGQSAVFILPSSGGTPTQITKLTPSYLHGWSPDGRHLVYTGGRNGKNDIYEISTGGGTETRLTDSEGLNDGPEFTPDGKYIYFNSTRSGKMQIWRMTASGEKQEQVTNDGENNWFPHISPDGKWIVFISFPADIDPKEHPYYKQCYIRLMPITGGQPRVVAYIYGGQGTINVPSWSPDSKRIAFVSNTDMN
jgi:TolB protein